MIDYSGKTDWRNLGLGALSAISITCAISGSLYILDSLEQLNKPSK